MYFPHRQCNYQLLKVHFGSFSYLHVSNILKIWNTVIKTVLEPSLLILVSGTLPGRRPLVRSFLYV